MDDKEFNEKIILIAYKPAEEGTNEDRKIWAIEAGRCWGSFLHFLKYVKIIEPPMPGQTSGGIIPLELWKHIKVVISALLTKSLISLLKARQIGISTIIAAYVLWYSMSHIGANVLLFSKGQPEAKELLAKSVRIYNQLPHFLRLRLSPESTEEIGFPTMKSSIRAFASTPSAGISYTASIVVCDEHAEHPYADENYLSSKPTRDAGGQFISVFTESPWDLDNLATAIFQDALQEKNDFLPLFFPWDVVPDRDEEWYKHTKKNIPERELAKLSPDLYMARNYPRSIEEALSSPSTIAAFNHTILTSMMGDTKNPIDLIRDDIDPLIVRIYQDFHIGNFYIAASDTSHGVGKDFNVTVIMDVKTGNVVADIMNNTISPEELALHSVRLLDIFKNPLWFIEDNDWGRVTITTAQNLGYANFGKYGPKKDKIGWHTDEKSRFDLFGSLIPAINNNQITIFNSNGLKQFYDVIRNSAKNGRIEAMSGRHDDYPMAVGICWSKKDEVQITPFKSEPIQTLHFARRRR